MTTYADTSAIVKLYVDEARFETVRAIRGPIVISEVSRVEFAAALWRKQRLGELSSEDARLLISAFEFDIFPDHPSKPTAGPLLVLIALTSQILDTASRLTGIHGLRAYDSVQLASALSARDVIPTCQKFAAFDKDLRRAAATEGFVPFP